MEDFKDSVKRGFNACKSDIADLQTENEFLKSKLVVFESENSGLKSDMRELKNQMNEMTSELKGLHIAMDYIKNFTLNSSTNNDQNNNSQVNLESTPLVQETQKEIIAVSEPVKKPIERKKIDDPYEALLNFKAKANKREMLKQKLVSMIGENGMNLAELKFMFVEHFKYTSKATFYNYLKELELEKIVRVEREHSKNYIYLERVSREI